MDTSLKADGRKRNSFATREAILNAAEAVFAEFGFDGARIETIARTAGYNQGLIFRYFGDKLGLYAEVIRRADWTTGIEQSQLRAFFEGNNDDIDAETIRQQLNQFNSRLFDFFVTHPQITRIFLWEMAQGWRTFAKIMANEDQSGTDKNELVVTKISELSLLHQDFPVVAQLLMLQFLNVYFLGALPLFQVFLPGTDFSSTQAIENAKSYLQAFIANGMWSTPPIGKSDTFHR